MEDPVTTLKSLEDCPVKEELEQKGHFQITGNGCLEFCIKKESRQYPRSVGKHSA